MSLAIIGGWGEVSEGRRGGERIGGKLRIDIPDLLTHIVLVQDQPHRAGNLHSRHDGKAAIL